MVMGCGCGDAEAGGTWRSLSGQLHGQDLSPAMCPVPRAVADTEDAARHHPGKQKRRIQGRTGPLAVGTHAARAPQPALAPAVWRGLGSCPILVPHQGVSSQNFKGSPDAGAVKGQLAGVMEASSEEAGISSRQESPERLGNATQRQTPLPRGARRVSTATHLPGEGVRIHSRGKAAWHTAAPCLPGWSLSESGGQASGSSEPHVWAWPGSRSLCSVEAHAFSQTAHLSVL